MADVRLNIAGRDYIVTCGDGEEGHLNELGRMVDIKVREAGGAAGGLNESRQLLFAALLLADQVKDGAPKPVAVAPTSPAPAPTIAEALTGQMAETLEKLAIRIEVLASGLERPG